MTANKLDKKNIEDILALTAMQEGILFHYRSNPESRQYFEQLCMRIAGNIDIDAFGKAWNYTAQNNEALRTVFRWEKLEKPVQVVLKNYEIPVRLCDISEYNEEEMQSLLERLKEKDREEGIDISTEPFRITLCKLCKDKYEMIISNHHIIYDGWSNSILLKEFFEAYNAFKKGEQPSRPVKNRYREFVKWHQSRDINAQKSYWSKYLEGIESRTLLPWDSKKQGEIKKAGIYTLDIERENTEKIKNFAREQKVALASVLYAAWGILLQRYNNSEDVLFGTTVSGRTAKIKGIENMVGLFINTPPLRVRSQAREKVSDLLNEVEKSLRDRGPYEDTPLTDIKSLSSMDNKESLFDSIMVIENYPIDKQMMNKDSCLAIESFSMSEMTNFDIAVAVSVFDGMELKFIYNSDVFLQATIERMAGQLINIINCMIENPCIEVSKIDILSKDERDEILYRYNNTDTTYPKSKTLSLLFEEQVQRAPDNIALVFEGMEMTYRELNEKANRLAHFLRKKGVAAGNIVGMLMERSPDMIVAIFGILKAGGAYLPIDPEYPLDRIASILRDSGTKFLVLGAGLESKLSLEDSLPELIVMDKDNSAFKNENAENIECINSSEGLAYVMYTSGSTGMPKGNLTTHYNIIRVVKDTNYIDITDRDVLLQLSNYAFDGSTFDIFGALLNGAKLVLVKSQTLLDIFELSRLIERENITVFFITTALFNTLADLNPQCFKNVRKVLFGGERVSVSHVRKVLDYVGPGRLIHVYGPTESTVFASYHFVDSIGDGDATIPIGKPISNTKIYVVDKNNNLQPFGAQGELCIAGDGLAKGYLNRPELTKEKFVPNPFEAYDNDKSSRGNKNKELSLMYRTGDLVRWRSDGSIEFIDRIDTQVKLRGFRVELGEIESKLLEYEGIREGIVVVREDKSGNKYLCAYFTSNEEVSLPSLREYLMAKLPIYMVPSCFVRLYEMPLNSNGKIDKKRLPEPETDKAAEREYVPLEGETEEKLARLWEEVLGVDRVGATDNFFELGGHSLKATVLSARIHREFNKSIPLSKILNVRTLRELADCIDGLEESVYSKINPIEENIGYPKGIYPASSSQKRMFVQHQFEGIGVSYNMPLAFLVEGTVNPYRIRSAFKELVMRHEPMRTSFGIYNGEIVQKIHSEVDFDVDFIECNDKSPDGVLRELVKPFNLEEAPLFRVTLIRLGNDKHILFMDMHHIISDGVSVAILVKEFGELYNGRKLSDLRIQYKDFSYWISKRLQDGALKKQEDFWFKTLEGDIPVLDMPLDFSRSDVRTFVGDTVEFNLGVETSALLNALAQKQGITLNSLLFSVYTALLHRYTGQEDIIIGSLSAGRNHPDLENMVGMFNNFLPIRTQINAAGTFEELMNSVNGELVKAYENQDYPYDMMVEKLSFRPELSRNPFFDTMLIFHNEIDRDISLKLEGLSFDLYKLNSHTSKLDLKLDVYLDKTGSIECIIEYNTALFKKETIERLAKHFANITREVLQKPNKKISEIEMLTREEKEQILFDFNDTNKEYPKEKTLSQVFEEQAERTPDNVAVIFGKEKLTYRELNQRANSLARVLRKKGVGKECIVAIMLERSKEMMVGILAVLKAGGAYLPISPSYPEERIRYMLEDSNATLLLTKEEGYGKKFESPLGLTILDLDDWLLYGEDGSNLEPVNDARSLAYVIYTSGSTGKPKGAMIEHYSVINRLGWMQRKYPIGKEDTILQKTPYTFDVSVWELFWWFFEGSKVCFLEPGGEKDPGVIIDEVERSGITTMHFVPSMLNMFLEYLEEGTGLERISSLRQVFASGEALGTKQVARFNRLLGKRHGTRLINLYGPTEATVDVSYFDCPLDEDIDLVPIGKPIDNIRLYIVDKYNNLQPVGIPGELCIAGDGVGRGYLNRPELTKEKFVQNPFTEFENGIGGGDTDTTFKGIMYRTGDLARWLPDGNIEYLGRIDHQVKVRGFRIEPGEIEEELLKHKDIKEAVVMARKDADGGNYLCAYITGDREIAPSELREHLTKSLPEYMVPSYFIRLDKMPLSPNGKIDRKALPVPSGSINTGVKYVEPVGTTEKKLAQIWQEVLECEKVGVNDNFFELGGHSLKAAILVSRIHKEFNVQISLGEIFKAPTIRQFAEKIEGSGKNIYSSIVHLAEKDYQAPGGDFAVYPVSSAQKRLFILERMGNLGTTYNLPGVLTVEGDIDLKAFEKAFKKLIDRHEILRTSFELRNGEPVQRVHKQVDFKLGYKEADADKAKDIIKDFIREFDIGTAPLFRAELVKIGEKKHLLMFDMHHIISDGVTSVILVKEFIELYSQKDLAPLRIQYRDYAVWQNSILESEIIKKQMEYWQNIFSDDIPVLNLPTDYPRPSIQSYEGDRIRFALSKELVEGLRAVAANTGTTLYMVLMAAYNVLLYKYTGQEDIIVGSPTAGRPHADLENLAGMFVNTLALRNYPKGEKTFREFLEEVKSNVLNALENQEFQFEKLLELLDLKRDLSRNPLFDTLFVLQNMGVPETEVESLRFIPFEFENKVSKFDITLEAIEDKDDIRFNLEYSTRLFKRETMEKLAGHFSKILKEISENPNKEISKIEMLTREEKEQILFDFNDTNKEYPKEKTLSQVFEEQAERTPDNMAVIFGKEKLTYRELNQRANSLARVLRKKGVGKECIVAIMLERSKEMMVGILAVLKAGGAYLPVSPSYPEERIRYMLEDSGATLLLTKEEGYGKKFESPLGLTILDLDDRSLYAEDGSNLDPVNDARSLAYVIYTSGSTGKPKGAMIEHYSVINRLGWMQRKYPIGKEDTILQKTPYTFDVSVWELFWWFFEGSKVCFLEPGGEKDPGVIIDEVERSGITTMHFVPSMLNMFLEYLEEGTGLERISSLRQVFASGEALGTKQVARFNRLLGKRHGTRLINLYGPTEATVDVSYFDCPLDEDIDLVPIGKPIDNIRLYIVDKYNNLQPVGIPGELCIAGDGVGRGYLNRPELTKEKFVQNPFTEFENGMGSGDTDTAFRGVMYRTGDLARWLSDGNIEYLGRIDHQVKVRGFRIEPGEIEEELLKHKDIKEAVVMARKDADGGNYLCAYITGDREIAPSELREHLTKSLPEYMVPSYFIRLDKMPLSPNGKIDRKALPIPSGSINTGAEYVEPTSLIEKKLAQIWQEVLRCEKVGVNDNFFDLGGNSLLLIRMHSKLDALYPGKVSITDIFSYPTVSKLAEFIERKENINEERVKLIFFELPEEYFNRGGNRDFGSAFKFDIKTEIAEKLRVVAGKEDVDEIDILLSAYIYLLAGTAKKQEVTVYAMLDDSGRIITMNVDLKEVDDFGQLGRLVKRKRLQDIGKGYTLEDISNDAIAAKGALSILPFFNCKNSIKRPRDLTRIFDIVFEIDEKEANISVVCEYDASRLRREKIKDLVNSYMKVVGFIIKDK